MLKHLHHKIKILDKQCENKSSYMKYSEDDVEDYPVLTHEKFNYARRAAMFFKGNRKSLKFIWLLLTEILSFVGVCVDAVLYSLMDLGNRE